MLISFISRASSRCASRRVPRTACHLRCCFPPASRPSRSPRPRRTFPAYDMALHRFIALGKVCIWFAGTDKHLCNLGVCRENGLHNRCFRAFPRLRLRIPRTLHALEQNLFSGRPNPGSTINHDGHSSHLRCNAPLVMDNPHCTLIRYLSVAARKSALNWPVVKSTSTWKISFPSLSPINRLASDLAPAIGTHASQGNGFDQRLAATPKDFSKVGASRFSSTDHSSFGSDHREQDDQGESTASCRHPLRHRLAR